MCRLQEVSLAFRLSMADSSTAESISLLAWVESMAPVRNGGWWINLAVETECRTKRAIERSYPSFQPVGPYSGYAQGRALSAISHEAYADETEDHHGPRRGFGNASGYKAT